MKLGGWWYVGIVEKYLTYHFHSLAVAWWSPIFPILSGSYGSHKFKSQSYQIMKTRNFEVFEVVLYIFQNLQSLFIWTRKVKSIAAYLDYQKNNLK